MSNPVINVVRALFVALAFLVAACGSDAPKPSMTLKHDGLYGLIITRLYADGAALLAATDDGLYRKENDRQSWRLIGLADTEILDLAIIAPGHYLVSTLIVTDDVFESQLMETTDTGVNWELVEHNFGGEEGAETIYGLHYDDDNNALYATGVEVLAASYDEGHSWEILTGFWQGFGQRKAIVKRNSATNEIWFGGQNAFEQMELNVYSLDDQTLRSYSNLLPNPSVIYGIQFDPTNANRVLVSGEGGVLTSHDNGATWVTLIGDVDHRFYFDVALDPSNPNRLYTGGWDKNWDTPQPLIFEVSKNAGATWKSYYYPEDHFFGGVRSLIAVTQGGKTYIYLGLYRGGIMKIQML